MPTLQDEIQNQTALVYWPNESLTTVCSPILEEEFGGAELLKLASDLLSIMSDKGLGLSAPQVGVTRRVFVMKFPDNSSLEPIAVVNPELELLGETVLHSEGCLSLPGIWEQVRRYKHVNMKYRDKYGTEKVALLNNMNARVAQHETDHLDGIMFFDHLTRQMRRQVFQKWEKLKPK